MDSKFRWKKYYSKKWAIQKQQSLQEHAVFEKQRGGVKKSCKNCKAVSNFTSVDIT